MALENVFSGHQTRIVILFCTLTIIVVAIYSVSFPRGVDKILRFWKSNANPRHSRIDFSAEIDISKVIATVDDKFLSVCLTWRVRDLWKFNSTTEKRLNALTKALSPGFVRIGGIPSDFVIFESSSSPYGKLTVHVGEEDLDRINEIAENAGWQVLFTLSVLRRCRNGSWDPSNPFRIVKYVAEKGYKFGWELGNESNHLKRFNVTVSPYQLAKDFETLRQHLTSFPAIKHFLVGPDVTQPRARGKTLRYLKGFLEKGHSSIDAVTWHHYYVRSQECSLAQFYSPQVLDTLRQNIKDANAVIGKTAPGLPTWLGETSSASGGGAEGISDRFVAGFMWLDKLGLAAQQGFKVVIRQALFYGNYSLIGRDLEPNPDYWLSLLHKKLFGTKVLEVKRGHQNGSEMVRMYAHCTNTNPGYYKQGGVSLIAMNLHTNKEVHVILENSLKELDVDEYLFTPDGNITSRRMKLNGKLLEMNRDSSFPVLAPRRVQPGDQLILPPLTYAFYVVPEAHALACLGSQDV